MKKKIVVLGGYGAVGRAVGEALARDPDIECVIAGRRAGPARAVAEPLGLGFAQIDVADRAAIKGALEDVFAVIDTCGPFHERDRRVAEECARRGVHYIDIAEAPGYLNGILDLSAKARRGGSVLVSGASSMPAVSAALIDTLADEFDRIDEIALHFAWGGAQALGPAALRGLLSGAGYPVRTKEQGYWREVYAWSEPRLVRLPAPLGWRRMYRAAVPGMELLAQQYGAGTMSARVAVSRPAFNRGLAILGRLRRLGLMKRRSPARLLSWLSSDRRARGSGVGVELRGERDGAPLTRRIHLLVRDDNGSALAASPAVALARRWARHGVGEAGAHACLGLVGFDDLKAELLGRDVVLVMS